MKINFTKKQYEALAKVVYLGNWMANAQRTGQVGDPHMEEYEEVADYVFSVAPQFGFPETFEHDLECGDHTNTTEVSRLRDEYDEQTFWDELCEMLGERDFYQKYTREEIQKMDREEYFTKLQERIMLYEDEVEAYGVERLYILKQIKDLGMDI